MSIFHDFFRNSNNFGDTNFDDDFGNFGFNKNFGNFGMGNPHNNIEKEFQEMHKRFANTHMGGGLPRTNFSGFNNNNDSFDDDFFNFGNIHQRMKMHMNMEQIKISKKKNLKQKKYIMMYGKKITRTEEYIMKKMELLKYL